ncbi:dTDP-4-dehydrorhamnose reductase [bacterium]|nr:dTDP-4-dehydrorhamnose reductase [bacterium]
MARLLVFGAHGQLGSEVLAQASAVQCDVVPVPRDLRLEDSKAVEAFVRECEPEWVLNAAALTDVDAAHLDPDRALRVNGLAPGILARAAHEVGARVIHISSEAVYDGSSEMPYVEVDACRPVSAYGVSKLTGDLLTLMYSPDSFVLRTSWLYSGQRGSNFPTRILEQLNDPGKKLSVVTDVVGNPTPSSLLVEAIAAILTFPPDPGLYHVCAVGPASKFDWAVEIATQAGFDPDRITPVSSDAYPTVAKRPKYVDLDCSKFLATGLVTLPTWQDAWIASLSN